MLDQIDIRHRAKRSKIKIVFYFIRGGMGRGGKEIFNLGIIFHRRCQIRAGVQRKG